MFNSMWVGALLVVLTSTAAMGASGSITRTPNDRDVIEVPYGTASISITITYSVSGDTSPTGFKECCWQDCIDFSPVYTGRASVSPKDDNGSFADVHMRVDGVDQGWYAGASDVPYTSTVGVDVSKFEPNSVHTVTFYFRDFYTAYCYSTEYGGIWRGPFPIYKGEFGSTPFIIKMVPPEQCLLTKKVESEVDVSSGNLSHSQQLFATKGGLNNIGLSLQYNSKKDMHDALSKGWNLNYEIMLLDSESGHKVLVNPGAARRFYKIVTGGYQSTNGDTSVLTATTSGYTITERDGSKLNFNVSGRLVAKIDRYGNSVTLGYGPVGDRMKLQTVADSAGRTATLEYDAITGLLATITDPLQKVYTFAYDTDKRLISVLYPTGGGQWDYTYDAAGFLNSKTDPNGNEVTYVLDGDGRLLSYTDVTNAPDSPQSITYPASMAGNSGSTTYTEADGGLWTSTYDAAKGLLTSKTDPYGKITSFYYYADRTMKAKTEPFDGSKRLTTFYTYDGNGNRLTETEPADLSTYSPAIDPANVDVATLGNLTPPIRTATSYSYDYANGDQVKTITDNRSIPSAVTTYGRYDETDLKVTKTTDPLGKISYQKDYPDGRIRESIDANGRSTVYDYYPDTPENRAAGVVGLLWKITGPDGVITIFSGYDKMGNQTEMKVVDPAGQTRSTTTNEYDGLSRLKSATITAAGLSLMVTTYAYDNNGNATSVIDAEGKETRYEYTDSRQVKSMTKFKDGVPVVTSYEYGATGCASCGGNGGEKLTRLVDAKQQATSFQYDLLGRLEYETDPLGNKLHYTYYDNSLVKEKYDATTTPEKLLTTYVYNNRGQITDKVHADGTAEHSTYYADGKLQTISNQNITYTYEWYANGWLKSVTDDQGRKISYDEYDNLGQRKKVTILAGTAEQRVITYDYDSSNRPWKITSSAGTFTYAYDNLGRRDTVSYPNGTVADYDFDELGRLSGITHKSTDGTPFASYTYPLLDKVGNRKTAVRNGTEFSHLYDDLYRLWKTLWGTEKEEFTYDPVGNRTVGPGAKDTSYLHNAGNQITQGRKLGYTYDTAGNQTAKTQAGVTDKSWTQTWDNENRLIKVEKIKGVEKKTVTFSYDPLGRRVGKQLTTVVDGITKNSSWSYVYDNDEIVVEIFTDETGNVSKTFYTHGPSVDERLALERSGQFYSYHADGLGSVVTITDMNRNIAQSYEYDLYGMVKPSTSFLNSYTYTGREWDREAGLYYYRARYYDALEGRFISKDPSGFFDGAHRYTYVYNNPYNHTDPTGLFGSGGAGASFPGHLDFPGSSDFDYDLEDRGYSQPSLMPERHFRDLPSSEADVNSAINVCDTENFERAMHRGQDYFSHFNKGYRWAPFQAWKNLGFGHAFDGTAPDEDLSSWTAAKIWTERQLEKWRKKCCKED